MWLKKKRHHLRYVLLRGLVIIVTLVIVKVPYIITKQLKLNDGINPTQLVKDIFLTKASTSELHRKESNSSTSRILLASTIEYSTLLAADV